MFGGYPLPPRPKRGLGSRGRSENLQLMSGDLRQHCCPPDTSWAERDAQGIYLCRVCRKCRTAKLSTYRPEILTAYTQADVDEPIEPDEY